jgi:hypothetical protein
VAVHIYTQTIHRTTQITNNVEECGPCPVFASFTPTSALQLREKHGKTSVRVRKTRKIRGESCESLWAQESINQAIQMYHSIIVDHNSMAVELTRSDVKGFKKCCILNVVDGTDGDVLWNVRIECEGNGGTDCEDGDSDTVW